MAVKTKQVEGLQAALDAKANTVDVPQVGSENIVLTAAQTTLSPTGKPTVNLFRTPTALPGDVVLHNTFSTGLDAEFAAGVATATIEAGTPTWNPAGYLDQKTGVPNTVSAISYERTDNHFNLGGGTIRIMWTPNYTGSSPSTIGNLIFAVSGNSAGGWARNSVELYHDSGGTFRLRAYNTSSQLIHNYNPPLAVVAGQTYEIEYSWGGVPDDSGFWVDGILLASDTSWPGGFFTASGGKIFFGGGNNTLPNGQMSRFHSDHAIEGFTIFNAAQHSVAGGNYTPIGLPGAGVSVENIDEITTTNYADGDELVITTPEFAGYTFVDTASPAANQLSLDSTFTPSSALDWLKVRRYADYWIEVARSPEPALGSVSAVSANVTTTQSIANATQPTVEFDTENYDLLNEFDPVTNWDFTATEAGVYSVTACVHYNNIAIGTQQIVFILKNGGTVWQRPHVNATGETDPSIETTVDIQLAIGDTISVQTSHTDTVSRDITSGSRLFIRRVA